MATVVQAIEANSTLRALAEARDVQGLIAAINEPSVDYVHASSISIWDFEKAYGKDELYLLVEALETVQTKDYRARTAILALYSNGLNISEYLDVFNEFIKQLPNFEIQLVRLRDLGSRKETLAYLLGCGTVNEEMIQEAFDQMDALLAEQTLEERKTRIRSKIEEASRRVIQNAGKYSDEEVDAAIDEAARLLTGGE